MTQLKLETMLAGLKRITPEYKAGAFDGDGHIKYHPETNKFICSLTQHKNNYLFLKTLGNSFGCGSIYSKYDKEKNMYAWKTASTSLFNKCVLPSLWGNLQMPKKQAELIQMNKLFKCNMPTWETKELSSDWLNGFVEAEGSFYVFVANRETPNAQLRVSFSIVQERGIDDCNKALLEQINSVFFQNAAKIYVKNNGSVELRVENLTVLKEVIVPYFERHPLLFRKQIDFELTSTLVHLFQGRTTQLTKEDVYFVDRMKQNCEKEKSDYAKLVDPENDSGKTESNGGTVEGLGHLENPKNSENQETQAEE